MLTLQAAARLLAGAADLAHLRPLARLLGCDGEPAALDAAAREAIGLPPRGWRAAVAPGPGALRALLVEAPAGAALRDAVTRVARRLAARSTDGSWTVIATERRGAQLVIAAWSVERHPPRVVALTVDRRRVVDSDADTLRLLAAAARDEPALVHAAWLDLLGRDAVTRRFYRALERVVHALAESAGAASHDDRRELALLTVSRLLFLSFIEAKGWLDADRGFLAHVFTRETPGGWHHGVLRPLFFGTLNTPPSRRAPRARRFGRIPFLNGGLFTPTPLERRLPRLRFPDDALSLVLDELLLRYRFTAREDQATWSDAAVDPEMLGRAFESLMGADDRRRGGAFYTPHRLVAHVTAAVLPWALRAPGVDAQAVRAALAGQRLPRPAREALRRRLLSVRLLDPACGSGAFLVHALETLAELARTLGDPRPVDVLRRTLLSSAIFGVDVSPMAVWLCELRLWLSAVIECAEEDPLRVPPLPNLDRHVRVGDALLGGAFDCVAERAGARRLGALRARYARATGPRKRALARLLEREERAAALRRLDADLAATDARRRDLASALRSPDLFGERRAPDRLARRQLAELRERARRLRARRRAVADGAGLPFAFATHFADVATTGFDLVLGNPPWVRPHRVPAAARAALRERFAVARHAAWSEGAAASGAGSGFAAQADLAALFVERGLSLLRPGGALALLVPAKLWRALAGGGVRRLLLHDAHLRALEDWTRAPGSFAAAVYPSLVVAERREDVRPDPDDDCVHVAEHAPRGRRAWIAPAASLPLTADPASPWPLAPPEVRHAFERVRDAGRPLVATLGRPELGVKTGCNAAFLVAAAHDDSPLVRVAADGRAGLVERAVLRPVIRGETLRAWRASPGDERIVWTHDEHGTPLVALPPHAQRWLARWRPRLVARADARGQPRWWTLFRVDAANSRRARVVWSDFGRAPRACVLPAGDDTVPLNSCYALPCADAEDAYALAAVLNAPLAAAWLEVIAEPARGGWRRHLAWSMAWLPLPAPWPDARRLLAPLGARGTRGDPPDPDEIDAALLRAFALDAADVAPLLAWWRR